MDIEQTCTLVENLVKCLASLCIARYPATKEGFITFVNEHLHGILQEFSVGEELTDVLTSAPAGNVYEVSLHLGSTILILPFPENQLWIVGPCMTQPVSNALLISVINQNKGLISSPAILNSYLRSLPQLPPGRLRHLGILLAGYMFQDVVPEYICIKDKVSENSPKMVEEYAQILPMRILENRYGISRVLSSAVSNGNFSLAYQAYQTLLPIITQMQSASSALRSAQNQAIILNAILRLAAEDGGVHPYELDQFSREVSRQIESIRSLEELESLVERMLRQYCSLVADLSCLDAGTMVRRAAAYAAANLSDNLTTSQMAGVLNLNPEYFSSRFSKEMGSTFTEYVNKLRVRQAAFLLKSTQLPIQEIAVAVGFNNASYFIKRFHAVYGMTPTTYRKTEGRKY